MQGKRKPPDYSKNSICVIRSWLIVTGQLCRSIKTRENDLRLLARISPEQYFAYDKLRQNSAARTIQKTWRNIRLVELASGKATIEDMYAPEAKYQAYGFRTAKKHGGKAHDAMRRSHELALRKALEQDPFRDKIDALHKHLQAVYQDKADSKFSPRYEAKLGASVGSAKRSIFYLIWSFRFLVPQIFLRTKLRWALISYFSNYA